MTARRGTLARSLCATRAALHLLQGLATTLLVFPFADARRRRALIRRWSAKLLRLLSIEVRAGGTLDVENGNLLVVANHVSWLDIFVLNAQHAMRFVAKAEIARWPLAGRLVRNVGTIFVERERRRDTHRVNGYAAQALSHGDVVAVFPEGTTTDGATVLPFHGSLLQPIVDSHGRLQPVALRYTDTNDRLSTAATYGDETFLASFWRICGEPGLRVHVHVGAPIPAAGRHRRELAREAREAIRRALILDDDATEPGIPADPATTVR